MTDTERQETQDLPTPGYRLLDLSAALQRYSILDPEDPESNLQEAPSLRLVWDWKLTDDQQFEVFVGVWLIGTKEEPQEVEVRMVGTFTVDGEVQDLELRDFVHTSAPAIMMPYVRDKVTQLTSDGPFGAYYLPIVNVRNLMKGYSYEESTGAAQLAKRNEADRSPEETVAEGG